MNEAADMFDVGVCGLLRTSENGDILRVNQTFCAWVGRESAALEGRARFQDLLAVGARIFYQTHWVPILRVQRSIAEVKLAVVHADGSAVPMLFNARRIEHAGAVVHEIGAFVARERDNYERELVVARKRLEAAVAEATRLRDEAEDRALLAEQMIGIVSHDLRTPLSSIALSAGVLGPIVPEGYRRNIERIIRSTTRATRLIEDLLDFTAARLGRALTVALEDVGLHAVVAAAVDELRAAHPGSVIHHVGNGDGPCRADPHRLAQLVGNLVANAVTYGERGGAVTVTSDIRENEAEIAVHNRGTPIPAEARAKIFVPMMRATAGGSARSVGLGLFIVSEIAAAHGGAARVESSADAGTTFRVVIPRRPPA